MSVSLYSVLPQTMETQHAKQVSDLQSEVSSSHTDEQGACVNSWAS